MIDIADESGLDGLDVSRIEPLAAFLLDRLRLHPDCELSVIFVDEDRMAELHVEHMDLDGPTDVMSWPMDELESAAEGEEPEEGVLGDIAICPQVAAKQAVTAGHSTNDEIELLFTHGVLHLIGYDHEEPEDEVEMFGLQRELLSEWASR